MNAQTAKDQVANNPAAEAPRSPDEPASEGQESRDQEARDQEALDRNRARLDVPEPRRILVLGATSGAGQTVTALMTGYMLASLREHPVAVVDLHDGTLARYRAPAAWLDEILAGRPPQQVTSSRPDGLNPTPKPSPARLDVIASHQQPRDGDEIRLAEALTRAKIAIRTIPARNDLFRMDPLLPETQKYPPGWLPY